MLFLNLVFSVWISEKLQSYVLLFRCCFSTFLNWKGLSYISKFDKSVHYEKKLSPQKMLHHHLAWQLTKILFLWMMKLIIVPNLKNVIVYKNSFLWNTVRFLHHINHHLMKWSCLLVRPSMCFTFQTTIHLEENIQYCRTL